MHRKGVGRPKKKKAARDVPKGHRRKKEKKFVLARTVTAGKERQKSILQSGGKKKGGIEERSRKGTGGLKGVL